MGRKPDFSCGLSFTSLIPDPSFDCTDNTSIFGNTITYECNIKNGTTYKVIITLKTDGEIALHKNAFRVYNAFELEIYLNIFTDKSDPSNLRPPDKAWDELISEHKAEFSRFTTGSVYLFVCRLCIRRRTPFLCSTSRDIF